MYINPVCQTPKSLPVQQSLKVEQIQEKRLDVCNSHKY